MSIITKNEDHVRTIAVSARVKARIFGATACFTAELDEEMHDFLDCRTRAASHGAR